MRKFISILVLSLFFLFLSAIRSALYANNISVSNITTGTQDTGADTLQLQFDLSWDNAWRDGVNYDAAWVFMKYSTDSGSTWSHATLKTSGTNPSGFSDGTVTVGGASKNLDIIVPTDKVGALVQISSAENASGALSATDVTFVWDYGTDSVTDNQAGHPIETQIRIMAIEIVYIPEGNFYVGDGSSIDKIMDKDDNQPALISATANIIYSADPDHDDAQFGNSGDGILVDGDGGIDKDGVVAVDNVDFPTGYNAFYIMKYELSQGQYADFLNTLTSTQASTRYPNSNGNNRHTISGSHPNYSASAENRACNFLSWIDLAAYADWAGLRPITELEYEKACRGPSSTVSGEYAWGSTSIHNSAYTITNDGEANATVNQGTDTGNASYSDTDGDTNGPLRCGIFAQSGTSRRESGGSYYGVMELSGNLWERPVTVGIETGRAFDGAHGDGELATNGNANGASLQYWPGYSNGEISGATGAGYRGGNWSSGTAFCNISSRISAAFSSSGRSSDSGARCARTCP